MRSRRTPEWHNSPSIHLSIQPRQRHATPLHHRSIFSKTGQLTFSIRNTKYPLKSEGGLRGLSTKHTGSPPGTSFSQAGRKRRTCSRIFVKKENASLCSKLPHEHSTALPPSLRKRRPFTLAVGYRTDCVRIHRLTYLQGGVLVGSRPHSCLGVCHIPNEHP